ncbi:hypothetical protein [Parasphingopyxis marina]|uniref:Uncharacterized protein n=1 Tax=Parasphingopyxis marina TaxID=2761622 RepID=A0A842HSS0_9SPHN|nr:hypothetical protein [Parasphingopyxis marina]MBC2776126.1 hypothetical protein [Parasphingopyxis marina]
MVEAESINTILHDPHWFPVRYDEKRDQFRLRRTLRQDHRDAVFLSEEYLGPAGEWRVLARKAVTRDAIGAPPYFIFHSGFCCSTLIARAFDLPGTAMGIKEPQMLQDVTGYRIRGASETQVDAAMTAALGLLARPLEPGEGVIVKPSCIVNSEAERIMRLRPDAHALYLHAPLHVFLGSIARKGITGRLWARELFAGLQHSGLANLGYTAEELFGQTDLQIAGLAWLAQHIHFTRLADQLGPERLRMLDSETLLAQPRYAIAALGSFFGLNLNPTQIEAILNGPAFTSHSKFGTEFDASLRESDRAAENLYADEIGKVAIWLEHVADGLGANLGQRHALLG